MQIPLYQERQAISTQSPGAQASNAGAAPWGAVAQLGGQIADSAFKFKEKLDNNETEAQVAKYYADRKLRYGAFQQTASTIRDPDELTKFYDGWKQQEESTREKTKLSGDARRITGNNDQSFYADAELDVNGAGGYITKARIGRMDDSWVTVQELARENNGWENPETGEVLTPSQTFEYATNKRMELGTVKFESGKSDIRSFDQVVEFRQISKLARENPDLARAALDSATQSPQNIALLEKTLSDATDLQSKQTVALQSETSSNFNSKYRARNLTRTEVDEAMNGTENIMGKDVTRISRSEGEAFLAAMEAQEIGEQDTTPQLFNDVADGWKDIIKASQHGKFDQKSFDKVMSAIGAKKSKGSSTPALSKSTIESQLNFAQSNLYKVAEGMGLDNSTTMGLNTIVDTLASINTGSPYNSRDNIMAMNGLVTSYMKEVGANGGQLTDQQITDWQKNNMGKHLRESAIIKARETYRVGEPVRPGTTPTSGVVLPSAEGGVTNYRYIGSGQFERVN